MEFNGKEGYIQTFLDMLSLSTGDFYFFYNKSEDSIRFSENSLREGDFFRKCAQGCSLEDWRKGVDERDLPRLRWTMDELVAGRAEVYSVNYRSKNGQGRTIWVNSRGSVYRDQDGSSMYMLGRLTVSGRAREKNDGPALLAEMRRLREGLQPCRLMLVGVDRLRDINLKSGRSFGDAVLRDVRYVLGDETGRPVYRVNGDWFAVNLPGADEARVKDVFHRMSYRMRGQCSLSGGCVGYTEYHVADEQLLFQYAEIALEAAKAEGRGHLRFFTPEDYESQLRSLELQEALRDGVEQDFAGFSICYQPQVECGTHRLYGTEALLRFSMPGRGPVSPEEFVPILEKSGLIRRVGLWALGRALEDCRRWRHIRPELRVSVNMSYIQLEDDALEQEVLDLVEKSGLPGSALTIEITESLRLSDYLRLNRFFSRWKKAGIELSVDDFGTGYSNLKRLGEMDVDEIKIDRSFVQGLPHSAYNHRLLANILELADGSGIRVCCEGVESREELGLLESLSPALLQGFYFSCPLTREEFEARWIRPERPCEPSPAWLRPLCAPQGEEREATEGEIARLALNAENDVVYLSDMETYEMYYLNPAGRRIFGVRDCRGHKCYKLLHGLDEPCSFCANEKLGRKDFYVWEHKNEYCGRNFLIKSKMVEFRGRPARLEISLDITRQEYVSQDARQRLAFADRIVDYIDALTACGDWSQAVSRALALVGDFYQADRAYLFQPNPEEAELWDNTFEWCAPGVSCQKENLQRMGGEGLGRWLKEFRQGRSVIILNLDAMKRERPREWAELQAQQIQRLIAVPMRDNGRLVGFVGVDNPRYCIQDDSQVRALAGVLVIRLRQENQPALPGPVEG